MPVGDGAASAALFDRIADDADSSKGSADWIRDWIRDWITDFTDWNHGLHGLDPKFGIEQL